MTMPPADGEERLQQERNIWMATVRPDGRPHLVPVWFVWLDGSLYVAIQPQSVKGRNLDSNPQVALALEDGSKVLICEGQTTAVARPYPASVASLFQQKYDWQLGSDSDYSMLLRIRPQKWLAWQ